MTWMSPEAKRREEAQRDARVALTRLLPHVYQACGPTDLCSWCKLVLAFDVVTGSDGALATITVVRQSDGSSSPEGGSDG